MVIPSFNDRKSLMINIVDGRNPANHLGWSMNTGIITILGGAGFCPSTVGI